MAFLSPICLIRNRSKQTISIPTHFDNFHIFCLHFLFKLGFFSLFFNGFFFWVQIFIFKIDPILENLIMFFIFRKPTLNRFDPNQKIIIRDKFIVFWRKSFIVDFDGQILFYLSDPCFSPFFRFHIENVNNTIYLQIGKSWLFRVLFLDSGWATFNPFIIFWVKIKIRNQKMLFISN